MFTQCRKPNSRITPLHKLLKGLQQEQSGQNDLIVGICAATGLKLNPSGDKYLEQSTFMELFQSSQRLLATKARLIFPDLRKIVLGSDMAKRPENEHPGLQRANIY